MERGSGWGIDPVFLSALRHLRLLRAVGPLVYMASPYCFRDEAKLNGPTNGTMMTTGIMSGRMRSKNTNMRLGLMVMHK